MDLSQGQLDPRAMSTLLELGQSRRDEWLPSELAAMLKHQVAVPLQLGLGTLSAEVVHELRESGVAPLLTLGELTRLPHPPVRVLRLVKRFAKMCRADKDNALPGEIVMFLYFISIALALVRDGQRISDLPDDRLRRGLRWLRKMSWLDGETQAIVNDALRSLEQSGGSASVT
jgi:hypothetical protein